ncbi:MAG: helix-turn-helix domain-containing protein [Gammaproteobacteria bacterium]|nr:helix-turn-helix domain-containing protein [Gammaproteobacteria bacterium]
MYALQAVQKGVDFVETRLESEISPADVAKHVGVSQWHYQRTFKALAGETLMAYIRARRLANSLDKLLKTDFRIIDIGLSAGYKNHESFTRAFQRSFGMTPKEYRSIGDQTLFLQKIQIDEDYIRHLRKGVILEPVIETLPSKRLVGLNTKFYSVDSDKNNIANRLPPLWKSFLERINEIQGARSDDNYGVIHQLGSQSEQLSYFACVEVAATETVPVPEGMEEIYLPSSTYARFTHRGEVAQLDNTVNYIYANWLFNSTYRHSYGADLEIYGADYHPESNNSVVHYSIPIK